MTSNQLFWQGEWRHSYVVSADDLFLFRQIALLKKYCTETAQDTARDAIQVGLAPISTLCNVLIVFQVFGGRGLTKTGMGRFIEHVCLETDLITSMEPWYTDPTHSITQTLPSMRESRYLFHRRANNN